MAKNKMTDLRDHLFATIEALSDTDKPMDLDRAKAIADVAKVVVGSAKVEVEAMRVVALAGGRIDEPGEFFKPRVAIAGPKAAPR